MQIQLTIIFFVLGSSNWSSSLANEPASITGNKVWSIEFKF